MDAKKKEKFEKKAKEAKDKYDVEKEKLAGSKRPKPDVKKDVKKKNGGKKKDEDEEEEEEEEQEDAE
jgi:hypothetical protein